MELNYNELLMLRGCLRLKRMYKGMKFIPNGVVVWEDWMEESLEKVEKIISEMKSEKRNKAEFWIDLPIGEKKEKHKILIQYFALRDKGGKYLGCLEVSRDITDIQKINGEKRLLDWGERYGFK